MNSTLYVVGYCPSCGTGPLGVRICGGCGRPNVLCEECDALWLTPDVTGRPVFPRQPDLPCPACETSLLAPGAHWASFFELEALGWEQRIIDVGRALGSNDS
ncbi:MAG: hypothetical protein KDA92_11280 [Planctomycetales bacterium]|nr:hypothetical protein [Planctomycetales bacterium]MCA9169790.1 hypothetical protein [Planctomycetales bacterium]